MLHLPTSHLTRRAAPETMADEFERIYHWWSTIGGHEPSSCECCAAVPCAPQLMDICPDVLLAIGTRCADPLEPATAVALSSTCEGLRALLRAVVELLEQRHQRAKMLCRKLGTTHWALTMSCSQLRDAQELRCSCRRGCFPEEMATLGMILRIRGLPGLRELDLSGTPPPLTPMMIGFAEAGFLSLCEVLHPGSLPELNRLVLSNVRFGPAGAEALATAIRGGAIPRLADLNLGGNPIGDEGAAALAAPLRELPRLEELNLTRCGIGNEGVISLFSDLGKDDFKALGLLWLGHNRLTDGSCALLASALDGAGALPQLWKVLVANNPVSDAAQRAVTAAYADRHAVRVERALSRYVNCS